MPAVKKKWPKLNSLVFCFQLLAMRFPVLSPRRFSFPFLQLLDLCVLDTGSLQFSYSILAASALNHMLPVKIEQVTGKQSETYKSPLSEQKIPYIVRLIYEFCRTIIFIAIFGKLSLCLVLRAGQRIAYFWKNYCRGEIRARKTIFCFLPLPPLNPT